MYYFKSVLLTSFLAFSSFQISYSQGAEAVDLDPLMEKIAVDLSFDYKLISGPELMQCEQLWEAAVPYGVKKIVKLAGGNLLVVSRSNLSEPRCAPRGKSDGDEEVISIYGCDGALLNSKSIRSRFVQWVFKSRDGKLVSVVTGGYDDLGNSTVLDGEGNEYITLTDALLYPSPDGRFLVERNSKSASWSNHVYINEPDGRMSETTLRSIAALGPTEGAGMCSDYNNSMVLWVFDDEVLALGSRWIKERQERVYCLALYEVTTGKLVWEIDKQPVWSVLAAADSEDASDRYLLMEYFLNDEGVEQAVLDRVSGRIVGKMRGGKIWVGVGDKDSFFYASLESELRTEEGYFRNFLIKFIPDFNVLYHGLLFEGKGLLEINVIDGYVWGVHRGCTIGEKCYPAITPVYDMRGREAIGDRELPPRVTPVILEGFWFIDEITEDTVLLIGQVDPRDGKLRKIAMDRAWIDG